MKNWIVAPFYKQPAVVMVPTPWGDRPSAETMMQVLAQQALGTPNGFVWGAAGTGAVKPAEMVGSFIDYAKTLTELSWAPYTCIGFDPALRALYYANLVIETLKQIPASYANWPDPEASIFDVWTSFHAK